MGISLLVTLLTLVLGYPSAYLLATTPQKVASILMIFVLLPFWTSLLVRTTSWTILMQDGGVFSQFLNISGLTWLLNLLGLAEGTPQLLQDALCNGGCNDTYPAALHPVADLQRHEDYIADLHAGSESRLEVRPSTHSSGSTCRKPSRVSRQAAS